MEWVYDRTQEDVDRAKKINQKYLSGVITDSELAEWNAGLKGALNTCDLNRIENNMKELSELVAVFVQTRTWAYGSIPRVSDYLRIRNNAEKIRNAWAVLRDTPNTPMPPMNTYQKWNDIEKILHDVHYVYERTVQNYYYCGNEIFAGEGIGLI